MTSSTLARLKSTVAVLATAALALGPGTAWAGPVIGRSVAPTVPGVSAVPGAIGASLASLSGAPSLTPSLAAPQGLLPTLPSGLSLVSAAQPVAAVAASPAATVEAVPAGTPAFGLAVQPAAAPASISRTAIPTGPSPVSVAVGLNKEDASRQTPRGPLARVFKAVRESLRLGSTSTLFEGSRVMSAAGFRPEEGRGQEVEGVRLDPAPVQPERTDVPGVSWEKTHLPGRPARPTLLRRLFGTRSVAAIELPGDPQDAAGVEAALRRLIQARPGDFGGISPAQLATVMSHKVQGTAGLGDMVYVNFKQLLKGVAVEGTYLGFTVKLIGGKAVVVGSSAQLFPQLSVDTFGRLDDRQVLEKAAQRLGQATASAEDFLDQGVRVMYLGGQWRAVRLMLSKAKTLMAAVDVNSGDAFAWDPRHKLEASGTAVGRGIKDGPMGYSAPSPLALAHVQISASDGKTYYADADGKFKVEGKGDAPVQLTVKLSGKYATVEDQEHKDLVVTVSAKPGEELRVVFNPEGQTENALAQVNAYVHTTIVHAFIVANGMNLSSLDSPMLIKANIDDECNAYYTPWSPSLNFFKSSERCANSSYNDVNYHEYGHGVDDAAHHGIPNGGLSEAIGDMISMLITKQPIIGRHFLKGGNPDYIRDGENTHQYDPSEEVHDQGQVGMGFAWKLRKALIASLGEVQGDAVARALILPAILASNRDIPAFINSVVLRDVGADGTAKHFKEIQAAAAAHGIKLKEPKAGDTGGWVQTDRAGPGFLSRLLSAYGAAAQVIIHR